MSSNGNQAGTQYAGKKRRRPQPKKDKDAQQEGKSNPSKRHRDRLNTELDQLAKLIPFSEEVLNKLDKLSILRLAVSYFRNKTYHAALGDTNRLEQGLGHGQHVSVQPTPFLESESTLSLMALHGFIVVITQDFNIFHVTETVQDYLGFPQCDVMNQSVLDLIHAEDRGIFIRHMQLNPKQTPPDPPQEGDLPSVPEYSKYGCTPELFNELSEKGLLHRSFICRLRCLLDNSSGFLALHFTGHLRLIPGQNRRGEGNIPLPPETGLFLLASPLQTPSILEIRTKNFIFRTKHKLDYTPLGIDAKGKIVLGYTEQQLRQRSGYEFIHSADMMHCADAHTKLMKNGESGLTVFRLLHKNNKWLWVTASARLIYRGGRPDYIISTHRPIPDQEGEDHMKKRSAAFRFDFTGHAILYGEVNPVGTRGGPEKNILNEGTSTNLQEPPAAKKMKISNGIDTAPEEVDRKTLFGAQSMQETKIYSESQSAELFAKSGLIAEALQMDSMEAALFQDNLNLINDSDICFYPIGTEIPQDNVVPMSNLPLDEAIQQKFTAPSVFSCMANFNQEPPPLHHEPIMQQPNLMNNQGYMQQNNFNPLKRPYPYIKPENRQMSITPENQGLPQMPQSTKPNFVGKVMPKPETVPYFMPQPFPSYGNEFSNHANSTLEGSLYFQNSKQQAMPSKKVIEMGISPTMKINSGNDPSIIESMTIKSTYLGQDNFQQENVQHNMPQNSSFNNAPMPANWKDVQFVGQQENHIQFDLGKIATEFQTNDPVSKLQNYLSKNPSHAMAIATGLIPEKGMTNVDPENVQAHMPSCQYQRNTNIQQQDQIQPQSNHPPIAQKDLYYHLNQMGDSESLSPNMSISSLQSSNANMGLVSEISDCNSPITHLLKDIGYTQN